MGIVGKVIAAVIKTGRFGTLGKVQDFKKNPTKTQEKVLKKILQQAKDTEFGKTHNFRNVLASGNIVESYQQTSPIHEYQDLEESINRMVKGNENILWPGLVQYFGVSSGTTSAAKFLPISNETMGLLSKFVRLPILEYLKRTGDFSILKGRIFTLTGRASRLEHSESIFTGEISGLIAHHFNKQKKNKASHLHAIPPEIAHLEDWDTKLHAIANCVKSQDIRMVTIMPSWGLVVFRTIIEEYNRSTNTPIKTLGEIWPNLKLITVGGSSLKAYQKSLDEIIGLEGVQYCETYGATEAFMAFQEDPSDDGMLLHLNNGIFYEFIRHRDLGKEAPQRFCLKDVFLNERYVPVITTSSGLWSYLMTDIIEFRSLAPFRIGVLGRTSEMISRFTEYVMGHDIEAALLYACNKTKTQSVAYHVCPKLADKDSGHAHQWMIEFLYEPKNLAEFSVHIDKFLRERVATYSECRQKTGFDAPVVTSMAPGTFISWLKQNRKNLSVQTKIERVREDRTIGDGLVKVSKNLRAIQKSSGKSVG